MARQADPIAHAEITARRWLETIMTELPSGDLDTAYRVTRAWLRAARDQLPVHESAHAAAQLPELFRGLYYEGWQPSRVPVRQSRAKLLSTFAGSAGVPPDEARDCFRAVNQAMSRRLPDAVELVTQHCSRELRELFKPDPTPALHEAFDL